MLVTSGREPVQPLVVKTVSGEIEFYLELVSRVETTMARKSDAVRCSKLSSKTVGLKNRARARYFRQTGPSTQPWRH